MYCQLRFSEWVPPEACPCLYEDEAGAARPGGPSSLAVELLVIAALAWLRTSGPRPPGMPPDVRVILGGQGGNLGSRYVLHKMSTGAQPGATILVVLARRLQAKGSLVEVEWTPRTQNQWADDLSKGVTSAFSPDLRRRVPRALLARIQKWHGLATADAPDPPEFQQHVFHLRPQHV